MAIDLEKQRERSRRYREKHKDQIRAYKEKNRARTRELQNKHRSDPEVRKILNERARARYAEDPEKRLRKQRESRRDPEIRAKRVAYATKWQKENPDKVKKYLKIAWQRKKENPILRASMAAYSKARNELLKVCPHCGGEVSIKVWKEVLGE